VGEKPQETEKMIMEKMERDEETKNETATIADKLPELNGASMDKAHSHRGKQWCHGFMGRNGDGKTEWDSSAGVMLQRVSVNKVRCISVYDDEYCLTSLQEMRVSFEACGITLQIDPYAVMMEFVKERDYGTRTDQGSGLEVA
jgi:hypothetical protein|tara:strand:- start:2633 stop:3061 length:429 start_codon:yes stop_codon:yes gene_type:complete